MLFSQLIRKERFFSLIHFQDAHEDIRPWTGEGLQPLEVSGSVCGADSIPFTRQSGGKLSRTELTPFFPLFA